MRAVILTGFLILSLPLYIFSTNPVPDSLLSKLNEAEGQARLKIWKTWFFDFNAVDKNIWKESLDLACQDAKELLSQDSAATWCFKLKLQLQSSYLYAGLKEESLEILKEAKVVADSVAALHGGYHEFLLRWYHSYADFYYMNVDFDLAEEYYKKAIEVNEVLGNDRLFFFLWQGLALTLSINEKPEEAIRYYNMAESLLEPLQLTYDNYVSINYYKAFLYRDLKKYDSAHIHFEMIIDSVSLISGDLRTRIEIDYASNLSMIGRDAEALKQFERLEPEMDETASIGNRLEFSERYSDCLFKVGRFEEGSKLNAEARVLFQEELENRRSEEVMAWQAKFNTSEKEQEILALEQEKKLASSRFKTNIALLALIALFAISILIFFLQQAKARKRQLSLTMERDRQINEYRDRLFSSITHDIRTPLALMMAPLERAQGRIEDSNIKSDIRLAQRNGKRLMELFNQILDWNRAEAKAMKLNNQVGRLDIILDSLCERFEQQAVENGIQFKKRLDVVNNQILLDYDKIDKILSNLIGNAIKFCSAGQAVELMVSTVSENDEYMLTMEVKDEGPGIDEEDQKNIFERYFQGKQGQIKGGTGIGLSLVHELVQILKGTIKLDSEPGKGTSFLITIPIQLAEEHHEEKEAILINEGQVRVPTEKSGEKPLVLVVEDEPELLEFLRSALLETYEVEIANSTTIGLSIAISRIPDIVISDWNLPDHNGGWLCKEIGKNPITAHIPVLILTAFSSASNQKEAFDSGAVAWMNKPFKLEVLERQLQTILNQQRRAQSLWSKNVSPILDEEVKTPEIDPFLQKVIDHIKEHMSDEFYSVEKMADDLHLSRVQLFRKVRNLTGNSPSKMIKEYRLQKARQLLKSSKMTVAEVAYEIGFSDPNYFSTVYKQFFNISPTKDQRA